MARRIYRGVPPSRMTLSPTSSGKGIALRARGAAVPARTILGAEFVAPGAEQNAERVA
jgi:hypothetical protein